MMTPREVEDAVRKAMDLKVSGEAESAEALQFEEGALTDSERFAVQNSFVAVGSRR